VAYYIDDKQAQFAQFPQELKGDNAHKFYEAQNNKLPFLVNDMDFEMGINTQPGYNDTPSEPDSTVSFPFVYEIDYVHYFRPKLASTIDLVNVNYNLDNHAETIFKTITLGGPGGNVSLSTGKNATLRATGDILLKDGFEIPVGATICILNTFNTK